MNANYSRSELSMILDTVLKAPVRQARVQFVKLNALGALQVSQ